MTQIDPRFFDRMAATAQPTEMSMSWIDTWSRCDRRFMYRYVRGLVPKATSTNMVWGTFFHRIAQEYYRSIRNHAREDAALHNAQMIAERCTLVENKYHGDTKIDFDTPTREKVWDTFLYYYENQARHDEWDEILEVEESAYIVVGMNNVPLLKIRSTFDLHAKKNGQHYIVDHKTTGDVEQNVEFLALDLQPRHYVLTARNLYQEPITMCMNYIARDVPPGFGHRPLETETGQKRSASTLANLQRKERYLQRKWLSYSNEQLDEHQRELVRTAMMIELEKQTEIWPRRIVKMGGMSCSTCPYFALCCAELNGRTMPDESPLIQVAYNKDERLERKADVISLHPFAR